ncbi:site-specific integrase [Acinetobacter sp. CUI P1]|nr:site-specific integrase [Acinetobacter sp. CUI P1]
MPPRKNLNNVQLQETLQELLAKHSNEDVLKVLSKMTGSSLSEPTDIPEIWNYDKVIEGFINSDMWNDYAETTCNTYRSELNSLERHLKSNGIDISNLPITELVLTDKITLLADFISKARSESSKNKKRSILRDILRFGLRQSGMNISEVERILGSKIFSIKKIDHQDVRYLNKEQISEVLAQSILTKGGIRNFVLIAVYITTGLRNSELTCLSINQVREIEKTLMVRRKRHKNELREAFISDEGWEFLISYIMMNYYNYGSNLSEISKNLGDKEHFVFYTNDPRKPISERTVQNVVKTVVSKCRSIPEDRKAKITPHNLRHSFAVNCLSSGVNFHTLMKLMDVKSMSILGRYLRLTNKDYQDDLNKASLLSDFS